MCPKRARFSETNNKLRYICVFFVTNKDDKMSANLPSEL